jgi:hypothetical protein
MDQAVHIQAAAVAEMANGIFFTVHEHTLEMIATLVTPNFPQYFPLPIPYYHKQVRFIRVADIPPAMIRLLWPKTIAQCEARVVAGVPPVPAPIILIHNTNSGEYAIIDGSHRASEFFRGAHQDLRGLVITVDLGINGWTVWHEQSSRLFEFTVADLQSFVPAPQPPPVPADEGQ